MDNFDVNLDRNVRKRLNFGKVCQKFTRGAECEECAASDALYKKSRSAESNSEKEAYLTQARTLYAKSRIFINAINVRDEDKTFPVRVYAFPPSVYDDLMGQIRGLKQLNPNSNVFHPLTGNNILITKKGSGLLTRYTVQIDNNPSEIPNKEVLENLKKGDMSDLPDLSKIENFISQNYMHITQLDNDMNILRLLPPYDGMCVYKELKFHRFTVDAVEKFNGDNGGEEEEKDIFPSEKKQSKGFDPFAASVKEEDDDIPDFGSEDLAPTPEAKEKADIDDILKQVREVDPNL